MTARPGAARVGARTNVTDYQLAVTMLAGLAPNGWRVSDDGEVRQGFIVCPLSAGGNVMDETRGFTCQMFSPSTLLGIPDDIRGRIVAAADMSEPTRDRCDLLAAFGLGAPTPRPRRAR